MVLECLLFTFDFAMSLSLHDHNSVFRYGREIIAKKDCAAIVTQLDDRDQRVLGEAWKNLRDPCRWDKSSTGIKPLWVDKMICPFGSLTFSPSFTQ